MSLLNFQYKLPVFKPATGFSYQWAWDYYRQIQGLHWTADEIELSKDIADFNKADEQEKKLISDIFLLFVGNEVLVEHGMIKLLEIMKPTEVRMMYSQFLATENVHIEAYSLFIESLGGFDDSIYTQFLDERVMNEKSEYVAKARVQPWEYYIQQHEDKVDADFHFRQDVARHIAVYAGATEGISLFAEFALLLKFQYANKYPGLSTIVTYSINFGGE